VATAGNGTVTLKWAKPASSGGATIVKYAVQRYNAVTKKWDNVAFPTTLSYTNGGLANGVNYKYQIRAYNAAGWGPASTIVSATPLTVPSAPPSCSAIQPNGAGSWTVEVHWSKPSYNQGAPVDYYIVEVRDLQGLQNWGFAAPTSQIMQLQVPPDGYYEIRVRSANTAGLSPWCTNLVFMAP
jgi:titin